MYYTITIRKHAKKTVEVNDSDFKPILDHIGDRLKYHVFENDKSKPHRHVHGILQISKSEKFLKSSLCIKGFHTKCDKIYDLEGWLAYCEKDQTARRDTQFKLHIMDMNDDYDEQNLIQTPPSSQKNFRRGVNLFKCK